MAVRASNILAARGITCQTDFFWTVLIADLSLAVADAIRTVCTLCLEYESVKIDGLTKDSLWGPGEWIRW